MRNEAYFVYGACFYYTMQRLNRRVCLFFAAPHRFSITRFADYNIIEECFISP